ncbi:hypothetical protein DFH08DRAFT_940280 [Mycena albidolilacea]|uniref:Uncharacterized protein n=1 Tax=Mycena albidolilacea TaxID=1033008 RepID=A0AAD7EJ51_9AGAR|nr:hypothetical protein DFH08DRAFT_940280 [Mycena albidolilacea]
MASSISETDHSQPTPKTRLTQLSRWPDDWKEFTSFNGSVYYTSDDAKLLTTEDVRDPRIRKLVLGVYDTQREWFEDIDADDPEMQVLNVCIAPTVLLASWSLGETYEYSTDDLQPERRAAFWDYSWEFPMHRRYLPEHLEAEFTAALTSVANDRVCDEMGVPFDEAQTRRTWQVYQNLKAFSMQDSTMVPALIYHIGRVMFSIASARDKTRGAAVDQTSESLDDLGARLLSLCLDTQTREMDIARFEVTASFGDWEKSPIRKSSFSRINSSMIPSISSPFMSSTNVCLKSVRERLVSDYSIQKPRFQEKPHPLENSVERSNQEPSR